jgi:hypothetical protein
MAPTAIRENVSRVIALQENEGWIGATSSFSTRTNSVAIRWPSSSCRDGRPAGSTGAGLRTDIGVLSARAEELLAEQTATADRPRD